MNKRTGLPGSTVLQSAIILPVPEAEPVVGRLRERHDPQARHGVPAHITLLYPFVHPSNLAGTFDALREFFRQIPAFDFSLMAVRRFPAAAYFHPEPAERLVRLIEQLGREWPEYPPYGGAFSMVIPHLTIADRAMPDVLDMVDAAVAGALPIRCRATEAWLMSSDERGAWSQQATFPLNAS